MNNDEAWDSYFIEGTDTLKNNLGIVDKEELKQKETDITFEKLVELYEKPIIGNFDKEHLCKIHKYLFDSIYPFAGNYRITYMFKGNSYFSGVDDIDWKLDYVLKEMNNDISNVHSKSEYASFLAGYYTDLISIHPFREGNGRTIREFLREFVSAKNQYIDLEPLQLNWANVNKDNLLMGIRAALMSKSMLEMEFMKALEPIEQIKLNSK